MVFNIDSILALQVTKQLFTLEIIIIVNRLF